MWRNNSKTVWGGHMRLIRLSSSRVTRALISASLVALACLPGAGRAQEQSSSSEGGTVRYITTPPSLTKTSIYSRAELASTQGGDPSYEAGVAVGGPLVEGKFGARLSVWYRKDGGWIDRIDP